MARKINVTAEMRDIVGKLGKDASFADAFDQLRARYRRRQFNEPSCQQAFFTARRGLPPIETKGSNGRHSGNGHATPSVASVRQPEAEKPPVVQIIRAAKRLIELCGPDLSAKDVIDAL